MKIRFQQTGPFAFVAYGALLLGALLLIVTLPAQALNYSIGLSATTRQSDNAFRDNNNKTSERQNEYGAAFSLTEDQPLYSVDIDYRNSTTDYAKDSQQGRSITSGSSAFRLGRSQGLFLLEASHNQERTLIDSVGPDVLENNDERSISNILPIFNIKLSPVDRLSVRGSFDTVTYSQQAYRDSERETLTLGWMHSLSQISQFGINVQQSDVEYTELDDTQYTYQNASILYSANLKRLHYSANLGYNQSDQSGEIFGGPSYNVNIGFANEGYSLGAEFVSLITDTSAGNFNRVNQAAEANPELDQTPDSSSMLVDQYKLKTSEIYFRTDLLCLRCDLAISAGVSKEGYRLYTEENNTETHGSINITYALTKSSALSYSGRVSDIDYEMGEQSRKQKDHSLEWRWSTLIGLGISLLGEKRDYESDGGRGTYIENYYGLRLEYMLGTGE